jgi:hypothetical protein
MLIRVIGLPTAKTIRTLTNVEEAVAQCGDDVDVDWVSDPRQMLMYGVVKTPSVIVNGDLRMAGHIPSIFEVQRWIGEKSAAEEELAA